MSMRRIFNIIAKSVVTIVLPVFMCRGIWRASRAFWRELSYQMQGLGREYFDIMMDADMWEEFQYARRRAKRLAEEARVKT